VLADARGAGVSSYACIGDVVGYNPYPAPCLERLRELDCVIVQGNHDYYVSRSGHTGGLSDIASAAVKWTRNSLSNEDAAFLGRLPRSVELATFSMVHNTLYESDPWSYVFTPADAERHFSRQRVQLCFHGHTHVPVVFEARETVTARPFTRVRLLPDCRYFINVGSVGQPRDRDTRAAYALYNIEAKTVELRRVPYDVRETQRAIRRAGLPDWLALRLGNGM
jgi:diadenosine tetraphosphatase ApaH/serine/threonine PP2A family protein phosphatase